MKRHRAVRDAFTVLSKFIRPPVCKKKISHGPHKHEAISLSKENMAVYKLNTYH